MFQLVCTLIRHFCSFFFIIFIYVFLFINLIQDMHALLLLLFVLPYYYFLVVNNNLEWMKQPLTLEKHSKYTIEYESQKSTGLIKKFIVWNMWKKRITTLVEKLFFLISSRCCLNIVHMRRCNWLYQWICLLFFLLLQNDLHIVSSNFTKERKIKI